MIELVQPLSAGNAIRVLVRPETGALDWRLLRKLTDDFSGAADPAAVLVYDGTERAILDRHLLVNDEQVFYKLYSRVPVQPSGFTYVDSASAIGMATAAFDEAGGDVLELVRDRLDMGLAVEVQRGFLTHETARIPVLTAPPLFEETRWPLVTVQLAADNSEVRGIGEVIAIDTSDADGIDEHDGWLSRVQLTLTGWTLNPDERISLRKALKRVVIANLEVFADAGMVQLDLQMQDTEDFGSYNAPVYMVLASLSCLAPSLISSPRSTVADVFSTVTATA